MKNFYWFGIQMSGIQMVVRNSDPHSNTGLVFKWWSEYQTKFRLVCKWHSDTGQHLTIWKIYESYYNKQVKYIFWWSVFMIMPVFYILYFLVGKKSTTVLV